MQSVREQAEALAAALNADPNSPYTVKLRPAGAGPAALPEMHTGVRGGLNRKARRALLARHRKAK